MIIEIKNKLEGTTSFYWMVKLKRRTTSTKR